MAKKEEVTKLGTKTKPEEDGKKNNETTTTTTTATTTADPPKRRRKPRKELPSVAYLLAHGDPETAHLPKTWKDILCFPIVLAIIFGINLLIFHHAPHHLSTHPGFKLPQRMPGQQQMMQQQSDNMESMQQQQQQHQPPQGEQQEVPEVPIGEVNEEL